MNEKEYTITITGRGKKSEITGLTLEQLLSNKMSDGPLSLLQEVIKPHLSVEFKMPTFGGCEHKKIYTEKTKYQPATRYGFHFMGEIKTLETPEVKSMIIAWCADCGEKIKQVEVKL